ncbi:MAG: tRNA 2-thiouridine(34) synthase MnmA [Candidatus Pacebacteria bacterium]|nr:tRNA 2-thiouridine(34) synthase MnmA [Candidatus Paceibacterota bacterium]MBP9851379.1 tRNA 2-thiouridine(34) synthase MnmA [Candidatus Paceibacterota bacterium]
MKKAVKTVFVGLSGGVDSSVSAAMLKAQGYRVVGVFIRTWHPDFIECNEEEERRDAMRVAAHLDIPFLTFDLEDEYKKGVADYMIEEYKSGRTPNPDVMCNKEVKFGAFLKKALAMGADYVATGHYAKQDILEKKYCLIRSLDATKDQVYFLWTVNQEQLSKIIFPIGHLKKTEVRKLANKFKLPVADKKDSQGICFLGDIDLKDFLKHYIKEKNGKVLSEKGEEIGFHDGAVFSTLGARHGFTITQKTPEDKPYYIVSKDINKNILVVSQNKQSFTNTLSKTIQLEKVNWISEVPKENKRYTAQIRYHGEFLPCKIIFGSTEVVFEKPVLVASGQSIVVYDKDVVLGGGIVA